MHSRAVFVVIGALLASFVSVFLPTAVTHAASTYTVNALTDTGTGTGLTGDLRYAINQVNAGAGGDTITIAATGTIVLTSALPPIGQDVTISGPGAAQLTVSGNDQFRPFETLAGADVAIAGITIANGRSTGFGGGILVAEFSTLAVTNVAFTGNTSAEGGGAIRTQGDLTVKGSTFTNNSAGGLAVEGGGGAIASFFATWSVENSTFTANSATGSLTGGGAITNCDNGSSQIINSTVSGNNGNTAGGGLYSACPQGGLIKMTNTIVSGNTSGGGSDLNGFFVAVNSVIGQEPGRPLFPGSGNNVTFANPLLGPLGDYGGPTQTMPLLPGSPAIGAGATGGTLPTVDQRGIARTGRNDAGAFQSQGFTLTKTSGDNQSADTNLAFAPLVVKVTASAPVEPVAGGQIIFTSPSNGPSTTTSAVAEPISASGDAAPTLTANAVVGGPYGVTAAAPTAAPVQFALTNTRPTKDIDAIKTNDVGGQVVLGKSFAWTITVASLGVEPVTFPAGSRILLDNLDPSLSYGTPTVVNEVGVSGPGVVACSMVVNDVTCTAQGGDVVLAEAGSGSFDVTFVATPSDDGPRTNPRPSGICMVDPDAVTGEGTAAVNNGCADTVTTVAPDLRLVNTNNVSGQVVGPNPWTWTVSVNNTGTSAAVFADGQRIIVDNLPNTGITYGTPTVLNDFGLTNAANISCAVVSFDLTCTASGATVTMATPGAFRVRFTATPDTAGGVITNPRAGGVCQADPDGVSAETDEANNACTDSVVVLRSDLTVTMFSAPASPIAVGDPFAVWVVRVSNVGSGPANFAAGQAVVFANLPNNIAGYDGSLVSNTIGFDSSAIACGTVAFDFGCSTGAAVSMPAGSSFEALIFPRLGTQPATYVVPRAGGVCRVDPDAHIPDTNLANNSCSTTIVTAIAADLQVTASNDVGGAAVAGDTWTWKMAVKNAGPGVATFPDGKRIVQASVTPGVVFDTPVAVSPVGVSGTGTIQCTNATNSFACRATGGTVVLANASTFTVQLSATSNAVGTSVLSCFLDPDRVVVEGFSFGDPIKETNNNCGNNVALSASVPGNIRIVNDSVPNSPRDYTFNASGNLTPSTFVLDDDADPALSDTQDFTNVARGTYVVTAAPVPGFAVTGIVCTETGTVASTVDPATGTATIRLESGEDVVCTFTHEPSVTVTVDQAAAQVDPTSSGPIEFDVVFSEPVTGFGAGDVVLGGTAGATTAVVSGGPTAYRIDVSGMSSDGTVVASIPAGVATDLAGNTANSASTSTDNTVTFDATAPSVTVDRAATQADPTNVGSIVFDVVFSEPVVGFTSDDVIVGGSAGATTKVVAGGPAAYTVTASGMIRDGSVFAVVAPGVVTDPAGNANVASTSTDNDVSYDTTSPSVTVDQAAPQADPTNVGSVVFDVVFSEPVTGFSSGDVSLGGTVGATSAVVAGGPTAYTVTVTGMANDGTIVATVAAGVAADAAGNANLVPTSTDNTVTFDSTAPSVTLDQAAAQSDPTNVGPVVFDVVFSEPVTGFSSGDVALGGTAGATSAVVAGGPAAYTVTVSGMTGDGTIVAAVAAGVASDTAGNANVASTSTDNEVTYDTTAPSVTIDQAAAQADPTNVGTVTFDVAFSEIITGFTSGDVTLSGTAGATTAVVAGGPAAFTVTVSGMTGDGTIIATVAAGAVSDQSGKLNLTSTSTDNTVTFDTTAPTATINQAAAQADPTNVGTVVFDVVFSEPVAGFTASDVTLSGTAGATSAVVAGGPTAYTVTVTGMTGDGTIVATLAAGFAADPVGNVSQASTSADNTVTYDTIAPTVSVPLSTLVVDNDPGANGATVTFAVAASDADPPRPQQVPTVEAIALPAGNIVCTPASGSFFPIGTTTVSCTATDLAGNTASASFNLIVNDNENPAIGDPADMTVTITFGTGATVTFAPPNATDNSGAASVECVPASGSIFQLGATTVTCTATDPSGNSASSTFVVTVSLAPAAGSGSSPPAGATLPRTGTSAYHSLNQALDAMLVGVVLVWMSSRRRRKWSKS